MTTRLGAAHRVKADQAAKFDFEFDKSDESESSECVEESPEVEIETPPKTVVKRMPKVTPKSNPRAGDNFVPVRKKAPQPVKKEPGPSYISSEPEKKEVSEKWNSAAFQNQTSIRSADLFEEHKDPTERFVDRAENLGNKIVTFFKEFREDLKEQET